MVMIGWHMVILCLKYDTCTWRTVAAGNKRRSSFKMSLFRTLYVCLCVCLLFSSTVALMTRISWVLESKQSNGFLFFLSIQIQVQLFETHINTISLTVCHLNMIQEQVDNILWHRSDVCNLKYGLFLSLNSFNGFKNSSQPKQKRMDRPVIHTYI